VIRRTCRNENSNIDWSKNRKHGFHYYLGENLANFRYPDKELLMQANVFTHREFEFIKLLEMGFTSEQIAEKIFLSANSVNTQIHH
jgi:DNA-binding NarL/FixJ family response regulator